jgi:hypothetical protein
MKVIFLDVDGVLINRRACKIGFGVADPDCVQILNNLIARTGAKIVMSSCWRVGRTIPEMQQLLDKWRVEGVVIGKTPWDFDVERGVEIARWLGDHREVESFVIIDDDKDMGKMMPWLVQTKFEPGLTAVDADIAANILEKDTKGCHHRQPRVDVTTPSQS